MKQGDDAKDIEAKARDTRRQRDHDDLNHERAGLETGRMRRFLPAHTGPKALKEKRKREAEQLSRLAVMMQNPEYAALREEAIDELRRYEIATERALQDAIRRGDQAEADAIRRYQVDVLGYARDRLYDEDDPPSLDEIRDHMNAIENAPPTVKQELPEPDDKPLSAERTQTVDVSLPPIR